MGYLAFKIPGNVRDELARTFPPIFPKFIGHHVTKEYGVSKPHSLPNVIANITVVGYSREEGLEAFVVKVDDELKRPDGFIYHITWSLDEKCKKPSDSKQLTLLGFTQIVPEITFTACLDFFY